jgi:signal transduction histidine kinase
VSAVEEDVGPIDRRLRAQREWLAILDALEESVILEGADGAVVRCNKAAAETFGFDVREIGGRPLRDALGTNVDEAVLREPRGVLQWESASRVFEVANYPLDEERFVHIFRDVTERRRLEAVAEAINVNEHLGFKVSALRHELGNALNVAKMAAQVLREDFVLTDDMLLYVDRVGEQLGRMEYLLKLLRSYSFAEVVSLESLELRLIVGDFARLTQHDFSLRELDVLVEVPNVPIFIRGDPKGLHQVLLNLASNAADAIPAGRRGQIVLRLIPWPRKIILEVEDNGEGLAAASGSLFRPFFTTKKKGTGLGLVIVKRILGAMGATIELLPSPQQGAIARLTFPRGEK